jgi:hypothetical protein
LHAPSGAEQPVIGCLRDLFLPLADMVEIDHMGNLTATRKGPVNAPHVVASAHADEIGAAVAGIEPDGFLHLAPFDLTDLAAARALVKELALHPPSQEELAFLHESEAFKS